MHYSQLHFYQILSKLFEIIVLYYHLLHQWAHQYFQTTIELRCLISIQQDPIDWLMYQLLSADLLKLTKYVDGLTQIDFHDTNNNKIQPINGPFAVERYETTKKIKFMFISQKCSKYCNLSRFYINSFFIFFEVSYLSTAKDPFYKMPSNIPPNTV